MMGLIAGLARAQKGKEKNKSGQAIKMFQSQGHVKQNLFSRACMLIARGLVVEVIQCLFVCLEATVALRQGQGHRNDHEHN